MPAFFGDATLAVIEKRFGEQMNLVATNQSFPLESVRLIQ